MPDHKTPTKSQPNPNISTEHQAEGDARHPRDVLDKDNVKRDPESGGTIPRDVEPKAQERANAADQEI